MGQLALYTKADQSLQSLYFPIDLNVLFFAVDRAEKLLLVLLKCIFGRRVCFPAVHQYSDFPNSGRQEVRMMMIQSYENLHRF